MARTFVTAHVLVLTTGNEHDAFATHVFGGILAGEDIQYPTRADALAGHAWMVAFCRLGNSPGSGLTEDSLFTI